MSEVKEAMSVGTTDAMSVAMSDAMTRIVEVGFSKTLIDCISKSEWIAWDASDEFAIVDDPEGINGEDYSDGSNILAA